MPRRWSRNCRKPSSLGRQSFHLLAHSYQSRQQTCPSRRDIPEPLSSFFSSQLHASLKPFSKVSLLRRPPQRSFARSPFRPPQPSLALIPGLCWFVNCPPRHLQQSSIASYADIRIPEEETDEGVAWSERPSLSNFDLKSTHQSDHSNHLSNL